MLPAASILAGFFQVHNVGLRLTGVHNRHVIWWIVAVTTKRTLHIFSEGMLGRCSLYVGIFFISACRPQLCGSLSVKSQQPQSITKSSTWCAEVIVHILLRDRETSLRFQNLATYASSSMVFSTSRNWTSGPDVSRTSTNSTLALALVHWGVHHAKTCQK